jgi:N-acetylneuraminate lyase
MLSRPAAGSLAITFLDRHPMNNPLLASENRILPALVTPLLPDGTIDVASSERLIEHLYQRGVGGLYLTGSTGEGIYLPDSLRRQIVEIATSLSRGRGTAIVHVGAVQAGQALELAQHASRAGAAAISSIPPFAGGYSWEEIRSFYAELARRSPLPVVAYYIPGLTGQPQPVANLVSLLEIHNIAGYKFTDPNFYTMQRLLARFRPDQVLYNGQDEALALGLQVGAHGGIGTTYNFMPDLILQIASLARAGRPAEALGVQRQVNEIIEALLRFPIVPATKQILCWQGLIDHPNCAFPRAGLTLAQQGQLRELLVGTAIGETLVR